MFQSFTDDDHSWPVREKNHNYGKTDTLYNAKHPMNDGKFDNNFYSHI